MAGTPHYGLKRLRAGESMAQNSYQFTDADRNLIDALLYVGAEGHHHTGLPATSASPTVAPTLALNSTVGTLPGGARVSYKYTLVSPLGLESAGSPESFVTTPALTAVPAAPTLIVHATTGGTLPAGMYYYALSAYKPVQTAETPATNIAYISVPSGSTNQIRLTYPTLPSGATGWNIYRRKPGESDYHFLVSVASGPTTYVDDGSVAEDCDRRRPTVNGTSGANKVTITLPAALPGVGWTWKVYRTLVTNSYINSLLHHVVEETSEGSGVIVTNYVDTGGGTYSGEPQALSHLIGDAPKVIFTGGAEVTGRLPLANVQAFPFEVTFVFLGPMVAQQGTNVWVCEFTRATIIGVRASLGRGYKPAGVPLVIDVNKGSGVNPTPVTIFTNTSTRPTIAVGDQIGARAVPQVISLLVGDSLTADVITPGGGATPTDRDLTITITMLAQMDRATSDMTWG